MEAAVSEIENGRSAECPLSLLVLDVDHFKLVNDTYGHLQGDRILTEVAELLQSNLRTYDIAARYGGDEFVALLPNTTLEGAVEVAERTCAAARGHLFRLRDRVGVVPVTLSIGVSVFPQHGDNMESLFSAADRALYQVKRQGRDGVAAASSGGLEQSHLPLSIERFVGREDELRALIGLLEDSAGGQPRIAAISGEAGIGKTTLLRQLRPEVRLRGGMMVTGRCNAAQVQPPYAPWVEVLTNIARHDGGDSREWPELSQLVPELKVAGRESRGGTKYALLAEMSEFLRRASQRRPLLVVLEDMQWADAASWDTLEYLIPQLESERILICLTLRVEEMRGEATERRRRLSRNPYFSEINLLRLTREELKRWMEAAFHRQDVGREMLAFLYRHTEGNPLFVVQVLRTLVDEGAIWYSGDRWEWKPVSELRLPTAVSDLIQRRLTRLSPKAQAVLATAAVMGREFDVDLAIAAGAGTEDELLDAVDEGLAASVLEPSSERRGDRYTWSHGKMADVLRDSINPRRRRRIHELIAQAMEQRSPGSHDEIATHYDEAGVPDKTYEHALQAADNAHSVHAHQEATDFLRMAERNAGDPGQLAEVRARLASIAEASGRYDEAEELCDLAIEWYAGQGSRAQALPLRRMRERLRSVLGQPARLTLDSCLALEREAAELGDRGERVSLLTMMSQAYERLGDRKAAERLAWDCVRMSEGVGDGTLLADSLNRLAITMEQDQPAQAAEIYRRALLIYRGLGDSRGEARCHNNLGIVLSLGGDHEEAKKEFSAAVSLSRTTGNADMWGLAALNLGVCALKSGEFERARELFGESLAHFAGVKNSERQLYALYNLAHLDRARGDFESASELYEVALSSAQRLEQSDVEIGSLAGMGLCRLELNDERGAREAHALAAEKLRARPDWFQGREVMEALSIRIAMLDGKVDEAFDKFDNSLTLSASSDVYCAAWLTAECAEVLYKHDPTHVRSSVLRYAERVKGLGYAEMSRRYEVLLSKTG
jgi:diguanylate cyclase (GGDEF)-like protein